MVPREVRDAIRERGPATTIYVSHGAGPEDWFVVEPQVGTQQSMATTAITTEKAVEGLRRAGRTVYRLEVRPWIDGHSFPSEHATSIIKLRPSKRRWWCR